MHVFQKKYNTVAHACRQLSFPPMLYYVYIIVVLSSPCTSQHSYIAIVSGILTNDMYVKIQKDESATLELDEIRQSSDVSLMMCCYIYSYIIIVM